MWNSLFSSIIGGVVVLYFGHFFKSADKTLQYVEEAFLLSNQINDYALSILSQITLQVGLLSQIRIYLL
ncbi:hypothetical protein [Legionella clemsonensis]|uniref:Uncharacterized protein n=1 Tax=Legionella clemsonensis TaxID=1867846 RepID=A0A222P3V3_9GAMM|nr:hypothetical protein [Legionella clemsonensis]ASQ46526.1 hypothetical protein clem_09885 [Legionella clemsonensis]